MKQVGKLNPFGRFCCTIGNLPTSYMESLTYEQQLLWFCKFLDTEVIPAVNANAEAIIELQNYLKNLDLQDEVNNKLDEMAESGQLTDIIAQYLQLAGLLCFNTKADLKAAQNLVDGSFAKTFGTTTYNDGYGYFYKIRTLINTDVVDDDNLVALTDYPTLVAEKIPDSTITSIIARINNLENKNYRKMILIGDSYCEQNNDGDITKFYWQTLRDNLNLTQNVNFFATYQSGAGFGNQAFLTKLQDLDNTITDKTSITDILVCGGWNDSDESQPYGTDAAFNAGILAFNNYVKANYPNARVTIAHISWGDPHITHNTTIFTQLPKSIERYKDACNTYGWRYLTGTEHILHYYNENFWQTDGNHPNQNGETLLGEELTRAFVSGSTNIYRLHSGTLTGSGVCEFINYEPIYSILNHNITSIFTPKSSVGIYMKASGDVQTINCDGAHSYEVGTIYSLEMIGYEPFIISNIPCYLTGTFNGTNSTYMGFADILISNSKLYIRPTLFINGSRAESFDFNFIWVPNFELSGPSIYA